MNGSNGTPADVSEIDRFLCLPCTVAVAIFFAPYIRGGVGARIGIFLWQHSFCLFLCLLCLPATTRPSRARRRGAGKDESDPPFIAALAANRKRGLGQGLGHTLPPLLWGSLSSNLSLREGSEQDPEP